MKDLPILMSGPMVRGILEGRKTKTRRIVKPQPPVGFDRHCWFDAPVYGWTDQADVTDRWHKARCPFGYDGDRLWVRETWMEVAHRDTLKPIGEILYRATHEGREPIKVDGDGHTVYWQNGRAASPWRPSIHMPRWASRLTLEVCTISVERLQEVTPEDCCAEGVVVKRFEYTAGQCSPMCPMSPERAAEIVAVAYGTEQLALSVMETTLEAAQLRAFRHLWYSIHGPGSWDANPWVWVIEFRSSEGGPSPGR